jgi:hypothetical protein
VNSASFELQDGKGKFRGIFHLNHLNHTLKTEQKIISQRTSWWSYRKPLHSRCEKKWADNGLTEEEDRMFWKVRPPPKHKRDVDDLRRVNNIEDPAKLGNVNILI